MEKDGLTRILGGALLMLVLLLNSCSGGGDDEDVNGAAIPATGYSHVVLA